MSFSHTELDEDGLSFFNKLHENEHWFPSFETVTLRLEPEDCGKLLRRMRAACELRPLLRHFEVEYDLDRSVLDVKVADGDEAFHPYSHRAGISISTGYLTGRWLVRDKHTENSICTPWLSVMDIARLASPDHQFAADELGGYSFERRLPDVA